MEIGVAFPASTSQHEPIALAETLGYSHAWLDDSQLLFGDPYVSLALVAERTSRISLGVGVTNPSTRIAPVTAGAMATLNRLAPGRVHLGIGTGNTALRTMGLPPARIDELNAHVDVVRGLLRGETVEYQAAGGPREIAFLDPVGGWIDISTPIPIWIAGSGPRVLELAGERGDGVILFGTVDPDLVRTAMSRVRRGAERAGRRMEELRIMVMTAFCLLDEGDSPTGLPALERIGPFVSSAANLLAVSNRDPEELPERLRDDIMTFHDLFRRPEAGSDERYSGYATDVRGDAAALMTDALVQAVTLTGTRAQIRERLAAMAELGVGYVSIRPVVDVPSTIRAFADAALG